MFYEKAAIMKVKNIKSQNFHNGGPLYGLKQL